jgi:hypothetical protein
MRVRGSFKENVMNAVIRTDDNGHTFLIEKNLTEDEANQLFAKVSSGHKQLYEIVSYATEDDYILICIQRDIKS